MVCGACWGRHGRDPRCDGASSACGKPVPWVVIAETTELAHRQIVLMKPLRTPLPATPRETTEAMARNICRELADIKQAIGHCCGDPIAEPEVTGSWMAHLLICSQELLHNLLIDTARKPRRIKQQPS